MSPKSWTRDQLLTVCDIYMNRSLNARDIITAELDDMQDFSRCADIQEFAEAAHAAYARAVGVLIKVLEQLDEAGAAMVAELSDERGDVNE